MKNFVCLLAVPLFVSFLIGCEGASKNPLENVRISELINPQQQPKNKPMTVGLQIYIFRIRADKLARIQYQIEQTDELPVKYNVPDAFLTNGLIGCSGGTASWRKIAPLLTKAQPQTKKHINLMIAEDLNNDVIVAEMAKPVSVIYHSDKTTAGIGFDAGQMVLRAKTSPLIGLRQACRLDVTPVYKTVVGDNTREFAFESAAFSVRLQPGQFVLLAPAQIKQKPTETQTIGNIISYWQTTKNAVDLYLVVCNMVNTPL